MTPVLFLMGATVGGYGTLIGAGGGFLLMPLLLVLFPREDLAALTSLSLSVVAVNAFSGTVAYAYQRRIDFRLATTLAAVAVPGAMLGAAATRSIPRSAFELAFGLTLLCIGALLVRRPVAVARVPLVVGAPRPRADAVRFTVGLGLSAAVGWLAGVLGIGGSPPQVAVLTHVMRIPVSRAMPTVQFMVMLSALAAVVVHLVADGFEPPSPSFVALGTGALLGAQVGAAVSPRLSGVVLVRLLAAALLIVGVGLLLRAGMPSEHVLTIPSFSRT